MENLDLNRLPQHIAIIMDGNGRWAQEQGQDRLYGHYHGVISVRKVVEAAAEIGIKYLTMYAFSTENWDRPTEEVNGLMTLFVETIAKEVPDLNKNNIQKLRKEIGMVFQGSALFDSMTVEENVGFPLKMFTKKTPKEIKERVDFVIDRVNLTNAHYKRPSEISGGMQKRVAIARAIVNNPKYLFCDEPNSGLDPKTAILIDNLIQEITQEYNITTVINTHDMNSVMEIGEKIVFLKNGLLEWEGSNKEIFKTDNEAVTDFVYSSELFKRVRKMYLEDDVK